MSYVTLTTSCGSETSPFAYSVGCGTASDSWTTANSTALAAPCNANSFTYTVTSNCFLNSNEPTDSGILTSDGNLLITEFDNFLILG